MEESADIESQSPSDARADDAAKTELARGMHGGRERDLTERKYPSSFTYNVHLLTKSYSGKNPNEPAPRLV